MVFGAVDGAGEATDFIGAGWSYPLGTDATGGVALVTREREIEQAMRLILGTARGERPMRPEFGCGIHDHVFASPDARPPAGSPTRCGWRLDRWEPRIEAGCGRRRLRRRRPGRAAHRHPLLIRALERPAQPRVPVLCHPRGARVAGTVSSR